MVSQKLFTFQPFLYDDKFDKIVSNLKVISNFRNIAEMLIDGILFFDCARISKIIK